MAVIFYHRHIVEVEAKPGDLAGLPSVDEFARGDGQSTQLAEEVYRGNLPCKSTEAANEARPEEPRTQAAPPPILFLITDFIRSASVGALPETSFARSR